MILFIQHIDIEGPGVLKSLFEKKGFETRVVELYHGDAFPREFDKIEAEISLGGPMGVYDEDAYPFLALENEWMKQIVARDIPFMGFCLGAQLLAKSCGSKVVKSPKKEVGILPICMIEEGLGEPLFKGFWKEENVFHWHEDMGELPEGARLLASSQGCPHQAFKVGPCAYGIQFHVELTAPMIEEWMEIYQFGMREEREKILAEFCAQEERLKEMVSILADNFIGIIKNFNKEIPVVM